MWREGATMQIIIQRLIWAGCLCFALISYRVPLRVIPIIPMDSYPDVETTHFAQRLGGEVGNMMNSTKAYASTRF